MATIDRIIKKATEHLDADEEILASVMGAYEMQIMGKNSVRTGVFLATDRRLVFFTKKLTGFDMESFPYDKISSVEAGKSLMGRKVTFFASGNKAAIKWINEGDVDAFIATVREKSESKTAAVSRSPASVTESIPDQIRKLAALRDEGIVSDTEFEQKKAELFSRM